MLIICLIYHFCQSIENKNTKIKSQCLTYSLENNEVFINSYYVILTHIM